MSILKQVQDRVAKLNVNNVKVLQLDLSGIQITDFTPDVKSFVQKFQNMEYLFLNDCGLTSLANLPIIPNLIRLELQNNQLQGGQLRHLFRLTKLQELCLANNEIASIDEISTLSSLKLKVLDLVNNDVTKAVGYRDKLFTMFNDLQILDRRDAEGNEVVSQESEEEDEEDEEYCQEVSEDYQDEESDEYESSERATKRKRRR